MKICTVEGCTRPVHAQSMCKAHYQRWRRHEDVTADQPVRKAQPRISDTCSVDGCDRAIHAKGLCQTHYRRQLKHGVPLAGRLIAEPVIHTYNAAHRWVTQVNGPANIHSCVGCGQSAEQWTYDNGDPEEMLDKRGSRYSTDPNHYQPMCLSCTKRWVNATAT